LSGLIAERTITPNPPVTMKIISQRLKLSDDAEIT
jgi:hypothetical protein